MKPSVRIGNTYVDISDKISIVLKSPVFNENGTPGSYVFNFSVPLTDQIKEEISFSHRPGTIPKTFRKNVSIRAGSFNLEGAANITALGHEHIEISLPVFNGSLKNKLEDLTLDKLPLGSKENLIEHIAIASRKTFFNYFGVFFENQNYIVNTWLRFNNIIHDPDETFPDDIWQGWTYHVPFTGKFIFSVNLIYKVGAGRDFFFQFFRNETNLLFTKRIPIPTLDDQHSNFITFSVNLNHGDEIRFKILMKTMYYPCSSGRDWRAALEISRNSILRVYSEYDFNNLVDRGYPYNNITFLPVHNNNYFANASNPRYEIDEESLDFINKKFPVLNFYDNGFPMFLSYSQEDENYYSFNIISPQIFLPHIINTIFQHAGINPVNNVFVGDGHINQLCVYTGACINNITAAGYSTMPTEFELADLLPDTPCAQFLSDICKTLGIVFSYDNNTSQITFKYLDDIMKDQSAIEFSDGLIARPSIAVNPLDSFHIAFEDQEDPFIDKHFKDIENVNFKGTVNNFLDLPFFHGTVEIFDCYYVRSLKAYFYYSRDDMGFTFWRLYSYTFNFDRTTTLFSGRIGETFEYKLPISPIMMRTYPLTDPCWTMSRNILLPASFRPGRFKGVPNDDKSIQLMFYRGLQKDSNNNDYPLGSNSYQNLDGDIDFDASLTEPFKLELDTSENSLFTKRFKDYLEWRVQTQGEFTFFKIMTSDQLVDFDFFRWYRIMSMDYLIKELKFEISKQGLSPVQITALPRTSPPTFSEQQHKWILANGHWNMSGIWLHESKWNMET